jgi:AcrR family transcriptional regulator
MDDRFQHRDPGDLTGRARIRDAALAEFAENGMRGATIRSIATRAGVSPALVQHHFGTKQDLRAACDDFMLTYLRSELADGLWDTRLGDPRYLERIYRSAPIVLGYLARSFVEGSPTAATIFDEVAGRTEKHLAQRPDLPASAPSDRRDQAIVLTAMRLGLTVLHEHASRLLGADILGPDGGPRVARAGRALFAPAITGNSSADDHDTPEPPAPARRRRPGTGPTGRRPSAR